MWRREGSVSYLHVTFTLSTTPTPPSSTETFATLDTTKVSAFVAVADVLVVPGCANLCCLRRSADSDMISMADYTVYITPSRTVRDRHGWKASQPFQSAL